MDIFDLVFEQYDECADGFYVFIDSANICLDCDIRTVGARSFWCITHYQNSSGERMEAYNSSHAGEIDHDVYSIEKFYSFESQSEMLAKVAELQNEMVEISL